MITTILIANKMIHIEFFTQKVDKTEAPDKDGNVDTCWRVNKVMIQFDPRVQANDEELPGWMMFTPLAIERIQDEIKKIHDLPPFRSLDDFDLPF